LRAVIEEVLEQVMFDVETGVRYVITERTVRGGEAVRHNMALPGHRWVSTYCGGWLAGKTG
jgi:hypothetical protein